MRLTVPSVLVLAMMTLAAMPPASATHGDTAYVFSTNPPFLAEGYYVGGPGYLDQYWDFAILSTPGVDYCPALHGGWDPHPIFGGSPGFNGLCNIGGQTFIGGHNQYIPYPNPQGFDGPRTITVTYNGATFDATLLVCDSSHPRLRPILGNTYCNDMLLLNGLV